LKFRRVRVRNFTAFDQIQLEFCDGINVFLGENGTGKRTKTKDAVFAAM